MQVDWLVELEYYLEVQLNNSKRHKLGLPKCSMSAEL